MVGWGLVTGKGMLPKGTNPLTKPARSMTHSYPSIPVEVLARKDDYL